MEDIEKRFIKAALRLDDANRVLQEQFKGPWAIDGRSYNQDVAKACVKGLYDAKDIVEKEYKEALIALRGI